MLSTLDVEDILNSIESVADEDAYVLSDLDAIVARFSFLGSSANNDGSYRYKSRVE